MLAVENNELRTSAQTKRMPVHMSVNMSIARPSFMGTTTYTSSVARQAVLPCKTTFFPSDALLLVLV